MHFYQDAWEPVQINLGDVLNTAGDKNISILHLSCRTSDVQFSLVLHTQTHVPVL